ncbi:Ral GTPase-activating protein subunit alpha-2 [Varanus komodoensis]|nr:Ral GTPase-activating protein subunit alpha-2 [Varanus komodoensis]
MEFIRPWGSELIQPNQMIRDLLEPPSCSFSLYFPSSESMLPPTLGCRTPVSFFHCGHERPFGQKQRTWFCTELPAIPVGGTREGSVRTTPAKIYPEEISPLLPQASGEKAVEDAVCYFLQIVLKYMVIQAASLEWKNKENRDTGFKFLFALFRKYYLPHLFPSFAKVTNLYKPVLDLPSLRLKPAYVSATYNNENIYSTKIPYMKARVAFIKWLVNFFLEKKYFTPMQNSKNGGEVLPRIIQTVGGSVQDKNPESESGAPSDQEKSHANNSTLPERRLSDSSFCSVEEQHREVYEMAQRTLLSTRGYVNFVHEVFRQAFLLPSSEISSTEKVVEVYRKWILEVKPEFMEEPEVKELVQDDGDINQSETEIDSKHLTSGHSGHKRSSSWGRTYSFSSAVNRGCILEDEDKDVKAGVQATLQVKCSGQAEES